MMILDQSDFGTGTLSDTVVHKDKVYTVTRTGFATYTRADAYATMQRRKALPCVAAQVNFGHPGSPEFSYCVLQAPDIQDVPETWTDILEADEDYQAWLERVHAGDYEDYF